MELVSSSNDNFEDNKILMEQVSSHNTTIEELNKYVASISSDIKNLQLQAAGLDKALSKLADNQATLLSMSAGKPQAPPVVGLNSINIAENVPLTLEETLNELLNVADLHLKLGKIPVYSANPWIDSFAHTVYDEISQHCINLLHD